MMALVPVLDLMIETRNNDKLVAIQDDIDKYQKRLDEREGFWREVQPYLDMKRNELRLAWTKWVLDQQEKAIWYMAGLLVLAQVTKSILEFCSKYLLQKSFYLAVLRLRTHLYSRCMELDLPSFQRITSGDLIARLNNDMRAVKQVFTSAIGEGGAAALHRPVPARRPADPQLAAHADRPCRAPRDRPPHHLRGEAAPHDGEGRGGGREDPRLYAGDDPGDHDRQGIHRRAPRDEEVPPPEPRDGRPPDQAREVPPLRRALRRHPPPPSPWPACCASART